MISYHRIPHVVLAQGVCDCPVRFFHRIEVTRADHESTTTQVDDCFTSPSEILRSISQAWPRPIPHISGDRKGELVAVALLVGRMKHPLCPAFVGEGSSLIRLVTVVGRLPEREGLIGLGHLGGDLGAVASLIADDKLGYKVIIGKKRTGPLNDRRCNAGWVGRAIGQEPGWQHGAPGDSQRCDQTNVVNIGRQGFPTPASKNGREKQTKSYKNSKKNPETTCPGIHDDHSSKRPFCPLPGNSQERGSMPIKTRKPQSSDSHHPPPHQNDARDWRDYRDYMLTHFG